MTRRPLRPSGACLTLGLARVSISDVTGRSSELRDTSSDSVNDACRGDSHLANTTPERTSATTLEELPQRIRDIATLRGLGYTFREISKQFEVTPQAI